VEVPKHVYNVWHAQMNHLAIFDAASGRPQGNFAATPVEWPGRRVWPFHANGVSRLDVASRDHDAHDAGLAQPSASLSKVASIRPFW
jgi:hypothetical protein